MKYKAVIALLIILIALVFYWWEWRPRQIRKECNEGAIHSDKWSYIKYDTYFTRCAREKGL
jgi:hypothetical protein